MKSAIGFFILVLFNNSIGFLNGDFKKFEAIAGIGGSVSFEEDLFNLKNDSKVGNTQFVNLGLTISLNKNLSIGPHLSYFFQNFSYLEPRISGKIDTVGYRLIGYNAGIQGRLSMPLKKAKIYIHLNASTSFGAANLDNNYSPIQPDARHYFGGSIGGGPGLLIMLNRHIGLAAEGIVVVGAAQWTDKPYDSSKGVAFDPGYLGGSANFVWAWGKPI